MTGGLSNGDSGKNYGLKWRIAEPFRYRKNIFSAVLSSVSNINIRFFKTVLTLPIVSVDSRLIAIGSVAGGLNFSGDSGHVR